MLSCIRLPLRFDPDGLKADVAGFTDADWVEHYNRSYYTGDWSAVPLRSVGGAPRHIYPDPTSSAVFADTAVLARCPSIRRVLAELQCPQQAVRVLRLGPGSRVREHADLNLGYDDGELRIHVPISTGPEVEFWLAGRRVDMCDGEAWYLDLNLRHHVANPGRTARTHLVVDCVVNDWLRSVLLAGAGPDDVGQARCGDHSISTYTPVSSTGVNPSRS